LSIHCFNGRIAGIKTGKVDKSETFRSTTIRITHYFWGLQDDTKCTEYIVEHLLINLGIKITDKHIGTNV
jgi:hypothetical protein